MIDLDKLLELEAKATQGPWALEIDTAPLTLFLDNRFTELDRAEDLELISAMRNNIKDLCAELRAARGVVEAARVVHIVHLDFATYGLRPPSDGAALYLRCECCVCEGILKAIKQYDEARRG